MPAQCAPRVRRDPARRRSPGVCRIDPARRLHRPVGLVPPGRLHRCRGGLLLWWYSKRHPHSVGDALGWRAPWKRDIQGPVHRRRALLAECAPRRDRLALAGRPTRALVIARALSSRLDRLTGDEQAYEAAQDHLLRCSICSSTWGSRRKAASVSTTRSKPQTTDFASSRPISSSSRAAGRRGQPTRARSRRCGERPLRDPGRPDRPRTGRIATSCECVSIRR